MPGSHVDKIESAMKQFVMTKSGFGTEQQKARFLVKAFREFDRDGSGQLDEEEFLAALVSMNIVGCTEDCLALFDRFDQDMSGSVTYKEFAQQLFPNAYGETQRESESKSEGRSSAGGVVASVKARVLQLAGPEAGVRGVTRILRRMDVDGNQTLNAREFREGLESYGLSVSKEEIKTLMKHFDTDGNGRITIDEFLRGLRGEMSRPRRLLVRAAWDTLVAETQMDGPGDTLTLHDLASFYSVDHQPRVIEGRVSREDALREFTALWDKNGDDLVEWREFFEYYSDVSAGIERDDYFELMIRNAWHISGGEGWSENTSNIRCLVTFLDGEQQVVELHNDFGVSRSSSMAELKQLLEHQGVRDISEVRVTQ